MMSSALDYHRKAIAEKGGFRSELLQKAQSLATIIGLVAAGSGVPIVPESLHYMSVPSVVFRPLADLELVSELAVAYRRDERSPAVNRFLVDSSKANPGQKEQPATKLAGRDAPYRNGIEAAGTGNSFRPQFIEPIHP